jgi:hydrogenase nickel incorporation protein HypA/HybF
MHELSIAQRIVGVVAADFEKRGGGKVSRVRVAIGALSGVEPGTLSHAYEVACAGTALAGSRLDVERVGIRAKCRGCGREFEVAEYDFTCPGCSGQDVELLCGRETQIVDYEVE